ncbi:RNA-protein complex protein Nop10 [Methanobrevibacter filiformis]|uniref:Ribosome biogenesis protein Nop10 n=1 Tax=Methanobrevibacter filiformis TaxID=55758 RepID=A0A166A0A4_9EURY|nr:RNA-protein complex protein Nop10 [Methanobrevibacter filiformis]KZX11402.1 H/ACA RNA-protein complex component Nop10p [Methanobrevibacter filiformis]
MKMKLRKCKTCDIYTIKDKCPNCEGELNVVYPPRYSLEDRYGRYRRILLRDTLDF